MEVLIIGGTGIISTGVVDEAINQGIKVTMLNRGRNTTFINPNAELIKCDVYNTEDVNNKLKGRHFDSVIDFLVRTRSEIEYSLSLFGKIADQYIFISSAQVYNTSIQGRLNENSECPQPLWAYSVNKDICERYVAKYCEQIQVNYTIIRPGVNYGNTRIPYGMFPFIGAHWTLVSRIKAGKPVITWNNGSNKLNLTRIEDFATGAVALLGNPKAYNETFNVVGDYVYSWKEVLDELGKQIGCNVKTIDIPVEFYAKELDGDTREGLLGGRSNDLVCSNDKLKSVVLSFKTKYKLEEGVKLTLAFYREHNFYQGFDYEWDALCDRIIEKYLKTQNNKDKSLHFINYENFGSRYDNYRKYKLNRKKYNSFQIRIILLVLKIKRIF